MSNTLSAAPLPRINLTQASDFLTAWIISGNRKPIILWGAPGIGKSAIIQALPARLAELTINEYSLIDLRLSQLMPEDLRGVPSIVDGRTTWNIPTGLPQAHTHGTHGILFLDEIFLASASIQAAAYQLLQDRCIGDYVLPDGWVVLAASNRPEDKAGLGGSFNAAIANRFACHFDIIADVDAWINWAAGADVVPDMIAFLQFRQELLHQYPDGGIPKGTVAYATPRSWSAASDILKMSLPADIEQAALQGCIGQGPSAELAGFLRVVRTLPDVTVVLNSPTDAPTPIDPATQYATATHLARIATRDNLAAVITYLSRMSVDLAIVAVLLATRRDPTLRETYAHRDFKLAHQTINLG